MISYTEAIYSLFTDELGHQGDIIINTGALMWLESIYNINLDENDYETGFNTDLHLFLILIIRIRNILHKFHSVVKLNLIRPHQLIKHGGRYVYIFLTHIVEQFFGLSLVY